MKPNPKETLKETLKKPWRNSQWNPNETRTLEETLMKQEP